MVNTRQAVVAAFLAMPGFGAMAADFDGTWKSNPASWKISTPGEYLLANGSYTCIAGCYVKQAIPTDGMDHAVTGSAYFDSDAVTVVNDHTLHFVQKLHGAKVGDDVFTLSGDGKILTNTGSSAGNTNGGPPVTWTAIETRLSKGPAGSHAISGKWQFSGASSVSDNATLTTYKMDGDRLTMTLPTGQSFTAVLGGPDAPYKGDPGNDTVSVRRVGPHAIEESDKLNGVVVAVATSTVSGDGATMSTVWEDRRNNTGGSSTATKK